MIIKMAEEAKQKFLDMALQKINPNGEKEDPSRVAMDGDDDDACEYESTSVESSMEDSANSAASFSSIDLLEDASSSSSSSSSSSASLISHANGPLYELSELMTHLPIKRGLSKFYQGKSQSYTSLASVRSIEDLAKRVSVSPLHRSKMKSCKSYAGVLDSQNKYYSPKATISKRAASYQRRSFLSSLGKRGSLVGDC